MPYSNSKLWVVVICCACVVGGRTACVVRAGSEPDDAAALDRAIQALSELAPGQDLSLLAPIEQAVVQARADAGIRADIERRLLEVLESSATDNAKTYACRQLGRIGSERSVAVLVKYLPDPRLSHMARYALEDIGGRPAIEGIRQMLGKTTGRERMGLVISLGRLGDPEAVGPIAELLNAEDSALREAAAVALGRIGTGPAVEALERAIDSNPQGQGDQQFQNGLVDALLEAAESLVGRGEYDTASQVYESLQSAGSERIQAAAYRGLMAARPSETVPMLLAGLAAEEPWRRTVAADFLVGLEDPEAIEAVAASIPNLPLSGQIAALASWVGRSEPPIRTVALASLDHPEAAVRTRAFQVLITAGTAADIPRLAELLATDSAGPVRDAAYDAIRLLAADGTDRALGDWIQDRAHRNPQLVRAAFARRSPHLVPAFLAAAGDSDTETRIAAFQALEQLATAEDLESLIRCVVQTADGEEREAAGRAVWMACQKIDDPTKRTARLLAALEDADPAGQCALLPILARLGGTESLDAVHAAMQSGEQSVRDAGYRALANWPDAAVAEELIEIARHGPMPAYRIWALRAYARVITLPNDRPFQETFEQLKQALDLATRSEDKKLILARFGAVRTPETLALLREYVDDPEFQDTVVTAIFEAAKGMSQTDPEPARAALEAIRSVTQDVALRQQIPKVIQDIDARKKKQE